MTSILVTLKRTEADDKDFQALVVLLDAELRDRDGEEHVFYAQFNSLERIRHVVLAYHNGMAVGCGAFRPYDEQTVEIKRMFVNHSLRGQGIAKSILTELEAWARENNYRQCLLETGYNQPEAIALYQKSGYEQVANYGPYAGIGNSLCMKKEI